MDVFTVLAHEIGRLLGREHEDDGVMQEKLAAGERLTPREFGEGGAFLNRSLDWAAIFEAVQNGEW